MTHCMKQVYWRYMKVTDDVSYYNICYLTSHTDQTRSADHENSLVEGESGPYEKALEVRSINHCSNAAGGINAGESCIVNQCCRW